MGGRWSELPSRPSVVFVGLAFAWTWTVWLVGIELGYGETQWLQAVGAWGPLLAAAVVTNTSGGDVGEWARQVVPKAGVSRWWYVVAVGSPLALTQTGAIVGLATGVSVALVAPAEIASSFAFTLFLAGALEEFGWRGFLQPRLQRRWSALTAAVVVGLLWALWHAPLVVGGTGAGYETGEIVSLLIGLPLFSIVMAWLYNSTRGGLLFVMLFHAVINTTPIFEAQTVTAVMELSELVVLLGFPLAIIGIYGREYLATSHPDSTIPGDSCQGS